MRITKRSLSLVILLLASSNNIFAAQSARDQAQKERQRQEAEAQKRRQEQIDRKMKEDIKKAGSAKTVSINPHASFGARLNATSHNTTARHNQTMNNLKRK